MPIFGLVWVASWVGCFFSSNQALLQAPTYSLSTLSIQTLSDISNISQSFKHQSSFNHPHLALASHAQATGFGQVQEAIRTETTAVSSKSTQSASSPSFSNLLESLTTLFANRTKSASDDSDLGRVTAISNSLLNRPAIVVAQVDSKHPPAKPKTSSNSANLGFKQCEMSPDRESYGNVKRFQIRVKDYVVSETDSQKQAELIARRLKQVVRNLNLKPNLLKPTLINGVPGGKFGNRLLFTVDQEIAADWGCTPELLAIDWINNLRLALEGTPLSLIAAQKEMHNLQETDDQIGGLASWYGPYFHGRLTATGEIFDENELTAAHPSLPFDTYLKVTNLHNGKSVIVRINDRGPYFEDRNLDLSHEAARALGSESVGVVPFEAVIMGPARTKKSSGEIVAKL